MVRDTFFDADKLATLFQFGDEALQVRVHISWYSDAFCCSLWWGTKKRNTEKGGSIEREHQSDQVNKMLRGMSMN